MRWHGLDPDTAILYARSKSKVILQFVRCAFYYVCVIQRYVSCFVHLYAVHAIIFLGTRL